MPVSAVEDGGVLTLAAVPIGRAEDASARLAAELARASLIAAEDTRRVRWLASSLPGSSAAGTAGMSALVAVTGHMLLAPVESG